MMFWLKANQDIYTTNMTLDNHETLYLPVLWVAREARPDVATLAEV